MKTTTIIIVDDHSLVRETWRFILNSNPDFKVIGEFGDGEDAVLKASNINPDVIIMDINLPGISGIEATEQILQTGCTAKILGVSLHSNPEYAARIVQKGAMGYVTKNSSREEMFEAIAMIQQGRKYVCREIEAIKAEMVRKTTLSGHIAA